MEIVAGGSPHAFGANEFWYALKRRGADYEQVYAVPPTGEKLLTLQLIPAGDEDGPRAVAIHETAVRIYNAADGSLERELQLPFPLASGAGKVGDIDQDGRAELVYTDRKDTFVVDFETGTVERQLAGVGGLQLSIGQLDRDRALEVVVNDFAGGGWVLDGGDGSVQWAYPSGFGIMALADVDGDGLEEIIAGHPNVIGGVYVFDADLQAEKYGVAASNVVAVAGADVDGDDVAEVIYAARLEGVHVLEGATGTGLWSIPAGADGISNFAVGDVDGDAVSEIVWGQGGGDSGPDYLVMADVESHETAVMTIDFRAPVFDLDAADLDLDGSIELVYMTSLPHSAPGTRYMVHDASSKERLYVSEIQSYSWGGLNQTRLANIDDDPQLEILISVGKALVAIDSESKIVEWRVVFRDHYLSGLELGFVDGDRLLDIVVSSERSNASVSPFVALLDARSGSLEWESEPLTGRNATTGLRLADIDGDRHPEVVLMGGGFSSGDVFVFSPDTGLLDLETSGLMVSALDTPDLDGDGISEIVIGTSSGEVQLLDPETGAVTRQLADFDRRIDGLRFHDLDRDGVLEAILALRSISSPELDQIVVFDLSSSRVASSYPIPTSFVSRFWQRDTLRILELCKGQHRLFASLGQAGFMLFGFGTGSTKSDPRSIPIDLDLGPADSTACFEFLARCSISAGAGFTVLAPGWVAFRAGATIALQNGFSVHERAAFQAIVGPLGGVATASWTPGRAR